MCSFGGGWWRDARVSTGAYVANHNPAVSDERVCVPPTESRLPFHTHTHRETNRHGPFVSWFPVSVVRSFELHTQKQKIIISFFRQ